MNFCDDFDDTDADINLTNTSPRDDLSINILISVMIISEFIHSFTAMYYADTNAGLSGNWPIIA